MALPNGRRRCNFLAQQLVAVVFAIMLSCLVSLVLPPVDAFCLHARHGASPIKPASMQRFARDEKKLRFTMSAATTSTVVSPKDDSNADQPVLKVLNDDTFSIRGWWEELRSGASPSLERGKRYDTLTNQTGGVWRTRYFGFLPATVSNGEFG